MGGKAKSIKPLRKKKAKEKNKKKKKAAREKSKANSEKLKIESEELAQRINISGDTPDKPEGDYKITDSKVPFKADNMDEL